MVFFTSLQNILPIILMIALGYTLRERKFFVDGFSNNLSKLIINIALPANVFVSILKYLEKDQLFQLSKSLAYTFTSFAIMYAITFLFIYWMKIPKGRRSVFLNAIINGNTIFIGLPLNLALFGEEVLPYFLMFYFTNTISTWGIGSVLIAKDSPEFDGGGKVNWKKIIPPPLMGFLLAVLFLLVGLRPPTVIQSTLSYVGNIVTPLSLMYIGIALSDAGISSIKLDKDMIVAVLGRFVLSPLVMILVILIGGRFFSPLPKLQAQTFIVQASAPVIASLPILANEAKSDVVFATGVTTITSILFVFVVPLVMTLVQGIV